MADEWGSSVWATSVTPANPLTSINSLAHDESKPTTTSDTTLHAQTLSFVDDAFDSGPPTPAVPSSSKSAIPSLDTGDTAISTDAFALPDDGFDDFDNFAAPASSQALDDEFGDFEDFGTGDTASGLESNPSHGVSDTIHDDFGPGDFGMDPTSRWRPLEVDPLPPPQELAEQVGGLLGPLWAHLRSDEFLSDELERQVEGVAQVLVTPESRALHNILTQQPRGISRPPTWTRSRIRRQHLISLGIPINLDEVLPQSALKPLPVLHIQTEAAAHHPRPVSAPPAPRPGEAQPARSGTASVRGSRAGTPIGSPISSAAKRLPPSASSALSLGPKPHIDTKRIEESLAMAPDNLSLLPLAQLESHLAIMRTLTTSTSSLLTHLLQQREALQQDSETYNKLIAELVGEAQKMKSGGARGRTGAVKRGSLM